jgi:hypothetical protein
MVPRCPGVAADLASGRTYLLAAVSQRHFKANWLKTIWPTMTAIRKASVRSSTDALRALIEL